LLPPLNILLPEGHFSAVRRTLSFVPSRSTDYLTGVIAFHGWACLLVLDLPGLSPPRSSLSVLSFLFFLSTRVCNLYPHSSVCSHADPGARRLSPPFARIFSSASCGILSPRFAFCVPSPNNPKKNCLYDRAAVSLCLPPSVMDLNRLTSRPPSLVFFFAMVGSHIQCPFTPFIRVALVYPLFSLSYPFFFFELSACGMETRFPSRLLT